MYLSQVARDMGQVTEAPFVLGLLNEEGSPRWTLERLRRTAGSSGLDEVDVLEDVLRN